MGVYETGDHHCSKCQKTTKHDIGWESELPDKLDLKCQECQYSRIE